MRSKIEFCGCKSNGQACEYERMYPTNITKNSLYYLQPVWKRGRRANVPQTSISDTNRSQVDAEGVPMSSVLLAVPISAESVSTE